jgi:hypothetical protein
MLVELRPQLQHEVDGTSSSSVCNPDGVASLWAITVAVRGAWLGILDFAGV